MLPIRLSLEHLQTHVAIHSRWLVFKKVQIARRLYRGHIGVSNVVGRGILKEEDNECDEKKDGDMRGIKY